MNRKLLVAALVAVCGWTAMAGAAEGSLSPQEREKLEKRMQDLSRELAEIGSKLGTDGSVRMLDDRRVAMNRAMLGVNIDTEPDRPSADGLTIAAVTPDGPAAKAGLRAGDVITTLDGKVLKPDGDRSGFDQLRELMAAKKPGDEVKLKVKRDGKPFDFTFKTEAYTPLSFAYSFGPGGGLPGMERLRDLQNMLTPPPDMPDMPGMQRFRMFAREWGDLEMVSLTPKLGEYFGAKQGVLVVHGSSEKSLPLEDGDVIVKVGDRVPASPEHVMRILRSYESGEKLKLEVLRNHKSVALDVQIPDRRSTGMLWSPGDGDGDVSVVVKPD